MKSNQWMHENNHFETVSDIMSQEFKSAMQIYFEAFPENERQHLDIIQRMIMDEKYNLVVVKRDHVVVGFSLFYVFEHLNFGLFNYMAISRDYRNHGIGSKLFHKTYECFREVATLGSFLLLEIEDPNYGSVAERSICLRRLKFYERLGARVITNFKYILPPLSESYPTKMLIMVYAGGNEVEITSADLKSILVAIYSEVYDRGPHDPYLRQMLDNLVSK